MGSRVSALDDRTASLFGERWASPYADVSPGPGPARDDLEDGRHALFEPAVGSDPWGMSILDSNATRRRAILQADVRCLSSPGSPHLALLLTCASSI